MATYVLPQVLVFQDFSVVPAAVEHPLRAHISGPHAHLIRYAEPNEKDFGNLGYYDPLEDTPYLWPARPAGGINDASYTKLYVQNALLQYFHDGISSDSTITKTTGYNNRIRSATVNFAENGSYSRSALLFDRDVVPGDIVKVRGVNGDSDSVTLWTYVKSLIGDPVASAIDSATTDADNPASQSASHSIVKVSGSDNCISITADHSAYDGLPSGDIVETYDILITESSVNHDATTARFRVISGSGNDDSVDNTPEPFGMATTVGTRGLTAAFNITPSANCSLSATDDGVSSEDLIAGQRWQITVYDSFTKPVPTSGGTYVGDDDTTLIITVTRGGAYSLDEDEAPQITVSTTTGVDVSGPTAVTAAASAVDIGSNGATVSFSGSGLRTGDKYYVTVTAETEGAMRTIELGHNLDSDIAAASQVDLTLYILKPLLEVAKNRTGFAPLTNYDVSDTEITVNAGITAYDATWTDDGDPLPLDVISESSKQYGKLYVDVRYWLSDLCNDVYTISDVGNIDDAISGSLTPDNPLKWGVFKALENSNGSEVKFTSVCDPDDVDSWTNVIDRLGGRDDVYGLVPLTRNRTVLDLYAAHVGNMSAPEEGLWRVLWVNLEGIPSIPVVSAGSTVPGHLEATTSDGEVALGIVEDDNLTSGTQYTQLRCPGANADFIANGVRPGDIVRLLYTSDGFGNEEYQEFVVDEVQSEDQLRLLTGPDAAISVAAKFEIWRNLTATEESSAIAINGGSWGSSRIRATWPDSIESSGTLMPGYFLNCSLAGLRSGILQHQGMTHLQIVGYSDVSRTNKKFNRSQLNTLGLGSVWVVDQDLTGIDTDIGQIYTRHALTTHGYSDVNQREEMRISNADSLSYRFKETFKPFIGVTNVTPVIEARLKLEVEKLIEVLSNENATQNLGPPLISATIVELRPHTVFRDRYVLKLSCETPYPFNNFEIHLLL